MLSLRLGSPHPSRSYILPTEWLFGCRFFLLGNHPSPLQHVSACVQLPGYASRYHPLSLTPQQSLTAPGKPIGLSPPVLTTPNSYFPSLYCFLSRFFHGKCLILLSIFLLRLGSKLTCFETLWSTPAHSYHSIIYLFLQSSTQELYYLTYAMCCFVAVVDTTLIFL